MKLRANFKLLEVWNTWSVVSGKNSKTESHYSHHDGGTLPVLFEDVLNT